MAEKKKKAVVKAKPKEKVVRKKAAKPSKSVTKHKRVQTAEGWKRSTRKKMAKQGRKK